MKPAQCGVCSQHTAQETGARKGEWLTFADHQPADRGMLSHPRGLEYFCGVHLPQALEFRHLPAEEAISKLREKHSSHETPITGTPPRPLTRWQRLMLWLRK